MNELQAILKKPLRERTQVERYKVALFMREAQVADLRRELDFYKSRCNFLTEELAEIIRQNDESR